MLQEGTRYRKSERDSERGREGERGREKEKEGNNVREREIKHTGGLESLIITSEI